MNRLKDKHCIVTGAASGIGRETAMVFAAQGADVSAIDVDAAGLATLLECTDGVTATTLDVTDAAGVEAYVSRIASADVLFNCAGMVAVGSLETCSQDDWQRSIALNMTSIFVLSRAVIPLMLAQRAGIIIIWHR